MSAETQEWLNTMTLIGFTGKRGNAWHYRESLQGDESNHYPGAIPVDDIARRLFAWEPVEGTMTGTYADSEGNLISIPGDNRKVTIRPVGAFGEGDRGEILGAFKGGYQVHTRKAWLIDTMAGLTGRKKTDLQMASAGLLKAGAWAWVQVELPENVSTPEGFDFRPFLTGSTSANGGLATTYTTGAQAVVCDNTLSASLMETGALKVKVRHSKKSLDRLDGVQDALQIVADVAETFTAQVKALCEVKVNDPAWEAFLESFAPRFEDGSIKTGRALTEADKVHDELRRLWVNDNRVSPWTGTAFGVVQAVNTYTHHSSITRGASHAIRNAERAVTGKVDDLDSSTLDTLNAVLQAV